MYNAFFGFTQNPFNLSPDPSFLYRSPQHEEALANLIYGVQSRKGFIVLTGHYGNWEATALALSALGRTLSVIGRELDNPLLEPRLRELRGRFGNEVIPKDGAFRGALKALRMGKVRPN